MIYEPAEDSYLLEKYVKQFAFGKVIDVGTGSGIQALAAAGAKKVSSVLAVDIQKGVISENKKTHAVKKISWKASDLFSTVRGKFDTIIFNPPYLPRDKHEDKESAVITTGGKHGYELLVRFLGEVTDYLHNGGVVLVVFSSLTKQTKVDEAITKAGLEFEIVATKKVSFEELFCYKITKSDLLDSLHDKNVKEVRYFTRGRRGIIFTGTYRGKKVAIKANAHNSEKIGTIADEARWLKKLNKKGIGPRFLFSTDDYLVYEFVEGEIIKKFIEHASKKELIDVLLKIFDQCALLDSMKISKEEMHHPYKHVLVDYPNVVLIDFERAHFDEEPNTVTQFLEYIARLGDELLERGIRVDREELRRLAKEYKDGYNAKRLRKELKQILRIW